MLPAPLYFEISGHGQSGRVRRCTKDTEPSVPSHHLLVISSPVIRPKINEKIQLALPARVSADGVRAELGIRDEARAAAFFCKLIPERYCLNTKKVIDLKSALVNRGARWRVSPLLRELAESGKTFRTFDKERKLEERQRD